MNNENRGNWKIVDTKVVWNWIHVYLLFIFSYIIKLYLVWFPLPDIKINVFHGLFGLFRKGVLFVAGYVSVHGSQGLFFCAWTVEMLWQCYRRPEIKQATKAAFFSFFSHSVGLFSDKYRALTNTPSKIEVLCQILKREKGQKILNIN